MRKNKKSMKPSIIAIIFCYVIGLIILVINIFSTKDMPTQLNAAMFFVALAAILSSIIAFMYQFNESNKTRYVKVIDTIANGKNLEDLMNSELNMLSGKSIDSLNVVVVDNNKNIIIMYH